MVFVQRFKSNIGYYRNCLRWSRSQLAKYIGVTTEAVRLWENSLAYPNFYFCFLLSDLFGCSISDLFDLK